MLMYPEIDPIAIELGPLAVRWYGLMYVIGILGGWWLGRVQARRLWSPLTEQQVDDMVTWIALGVILGGRIGSIVFYNFEDWIQRPIMLLEIWKGGMSFHGGFLGVLLAMYLYGRKTGVGFWRLTDFIAPIVTLGLGTGRIGNFINGELWGRPTDLPWGMQVPCVQGTWDALCQGQLGLPNSTAMTPPLHPTSLYEATLEGLLLFTILWVFASKERPRMAVSGMFLICYGIFRTGVEFVRMPDSHIGYMLDDWFTRGQLLTIPMIIWGVVLLVIAYRKADYRSDYKAANN